MLAAVSRDFHQRETSYQNLYGQEAMESSSLVCRSRHLCHRVPALIGSLYEKLGTTDRSRSQYFGSALGGVFKAYWRIVWQRCRRCVLYYSYTRRAFNSFQCSPHEVAVVFIFFQGLIDAFKEPLAFSQSFCPATQGRPFEDV